jgi:hypothetical protein
LETVAAITVMAKKLSQGALKRRGRPPRPGGPIPKAEVQRAYRERLKQAGKAVKLVDADFDSAEQRAWVAKLHEDLGNALRNLELREQDVARLQERNGYLESELKLQGLHLTGALKDVLVLKRQLAQKPTRR